MKKIKALLACALFAVCSIALADRYIDDNEKYENSPLCTEDPACVEMAVKMAREKAARAEAAEKDWNERPIEKAGDIIIVLGLLAGLIYYFFFRVDPKTRKDDESL